MNSVIEYLKHLDLSETEAKIYLTLIENGPKRVRELAESVGLKRTTTYFHIDSLIKKGLIAEEVKGSGARIVANPPQWLKYLVDNKIKTAQILQEQYPTIVKTINTAFSKSQTPEEETEIKYFTGIKSVEFIYEEAFKGNELRSYVYLAEPKIIFSDNISLMSNAFNKNKNLKIREIVDDSSFSRKETQILSLHKNYSYKFMSKNLKLTAEDILIYNGNVAIINIKGKISGVVIHNTDYYNNSKELFDFIWNTLPEPEVSL
ncbi:helix-turn-helix domain-containing protein [Patescibacteria group bacterium]|nr:helix-turn-helix domain-containing protein [Patescibacteria group bacterium]MBU4016154.1 helix-turn-helix domain-containing protein [Patescibacteria group bacterium]MBU4099422.1 helix-turn-helix domain-containing protein [Patescibacteria group bacterium]